MKICVTSDTHNLQQYIDIDTNVDTIIHCGDFTSSKKGNKQDTIEFLNWYSSLYIKNKILIAGNHDSYLYKLYQDKQIDKFFKENYPNIHYLQDSSIVIDGIKFYGTPWTLRYGDWDFMKKNENDLFEVFSKIDIDTNVLISHSPAETILDYCQGKILGSSSLKYHIDNNLKNLKYHLFGHIHESYGYKDLHTYTAINSAFLDYTKDNQPISFDYYTKDFL